MNYIFSNQKLHKKVIVYKDLIVLISLLSGGKYGWTVNMFQLVLAVLLTDSSCRQSRCYNFVDNSTLNSSLAKTQGSLYIRFKKQFLWY